MKSFIFLQSFFNKKLVKGFTTCTSCPSEDSDCKNPCGCGEPGGGPRGCGGGAGGAGGGGGNGPFPRSLSGPSVRSEILDLDNEETLALIEQEVEDFIAVGDVWGPIGPQGPYAPYEPPMIPFDQLGGPGCPSCGGGCCGGCGGGGGLGLDLGNVFNPGLQLNGNGWQINFAPYGRQHPNNFFECVIRF